MKELRLSSTCAPLTLASLSLSKIFPLSGHYCLRGRDRQGRLGSVLLFMHKMTSGGIRQLELRCLGFHKIYITPTTMRRFLSKLNIKMSSGRKCNPYTTLVVEFSSTASYKSYFCPEESESMSIPWRFGLCVCVWNSDCLKSLSKYCISLPQLMYSPHPNGRINTAGERVPVIDE